MQTIRQWAVATIVTALLSTVFFISAIITTIAAAVNGETEIAGPVWILTGLCVLVTFICFVGAVIISFIEHNKNLNK